MQTKQPSLAWLEDPAVFAVGRLPAHSDHRFFVNGQEPVQPLDGRWRFAYSPSPAARPADFWQAGADLSAFGTIAVPGHIELQGHGQIQYINTLYPWDARRELRPPHIAWDDCPVGSYVTEFDLAEALWGGRVCISFQGVEQAFYLWCNGQFVGYSEDSFTPSDFDLTPYVRKTGNRLCVEVYKRSSAAWLEDQDFFRFFGIFRPVFLYGKPDVHIDDLWLRASLTADGGAGTLAPRLKLSYADPARAAGCTVGCRIAAPGGAVVYDAPLALSPAGEDAGRTVWEAAPIALPGVRPWSHEDPALYTVTLTLRGPDGREIESVPCRTGFRRFEMIDGIMCLNGERVFFNGVNRHEWSAENGRAIGPGDMHAAMAVLRRNNINAVRTCHYPDQSLWYDLCDENGIYMIDEANLESHGSWQKLGAVEPGWNVPGGLPEWRDCVVDRARSMFERDKNHTAVLIWSCGNESFAGADILEMSRFFRQNDPGRLVHYEGVFPARQSAAYDPAWEEISDIESRMYATPDEIRAYLESAPAKPFLVCEYMHDMGNSLGGMESYIRLGEEFPQYQGGFIWDYMDQALWRTDARGRRALGYGGDFGERPTDYAFCANGIVFADGTEKPAMQEVRYWHRSAAARAAQDAANAAAACRSAAALQAENAERQQADAAAPDLELVHGDGGLGVRGRGAHGSFEYLFSWPEGGPVSLLANGTQWLYRAPRPAFWRAATENDKGCGFPARSSVWLAVEAAARCTGHAVEQQTPRAVTVVYHFACDAAPGAAAELRYTVAAGGTLTLQAVYHGAPGLPELPCFGVRLTTPAQRGGKTRRERNQNVKDFLAGKRETPFADGKQPPKSTKAAPVKEAEAPPPEIHLPPTPEVPPRPVEEGKIVYLKLSELHPFHTLRDHPFKVQDDKAMDDLVGTIKEHGIMTPATVRPEKDGSGYEIIAGHRRCHGGERAGLEEIPCIVREMTDLEAVREMKNSNKQRGDPLSSELARLLDLEVEAIKRQGARPKNDKEAESLGKLSVEIVGKEHDMNYKKVLRYMRQSMKPGL